MKNTFWLLLAFVVGACNPPPESVKETNSTTEDTIEIIADWGEAEGDLDNDGIAERVIVFNTSDSSDLGAIRELRILKKENEEWTVWKRSRAAVLESQAGGAMGDPFNGVEIEKGILLIYHYGGSSWRWGHTDKYHFQNDAFELIGYSSNYGRLCDYFINVDYNLSTGTVIYKKLTEDCEKETEKRELEQFKHQIETLTLQNRYPCDIEFVSPEKGYKVFL